MLAEYHGTLTISIATQQINYSGYHTCCFSKCSLSAPKIVTVLLLLTREGTCRIEFILYMLSVFMVNK